MRKWFFSLTVLVVTILFSAGLVSAQQGFREGVKITIKKQDGTTLSGVLTSFPREVVLDTEIGFKANIDVSRVYRIKVLNRKMQDRRMLEFYTIDNKQLRGIYCCSFMFTVDLGPYGIQKFDLNNPNRFQVIEVAIEGAPRVGPIPPAVVVPGGPAQAQRIDASPFTILYFGHKVTWQQARAECKSLGMEIASIHSMQENNIIVSKLRSINWAQRLWHGAWIGLTDEQAEGLWQWIDGSPLDFRNFGPASGEPNGGITENYGAIELARAGNPDGWWNDARAGESYGAVVCRASTPVAAPTPPAPTVPVPPEQPFPAPSHSPPPPPQVSQPYMPPPVPRPPLVPTAGVQCVDVQGEATIFNNDVPSAKAEAIARAKWTAIEQVAGVAVKSQTVVQNARLVDEAISQQIKGVVKNYKVKNQWVQGNLITVLVNVCVEKTKAFDAAGLMALNNSLAVFIPARKPRVVGEANIRYGNSSAYGVTTVDEYEETNILSETVIGRLTEAGVTVVDVAPLNLADAQMIEQAMRSGSSMVIRSLMYRTLSNLLLIGKVDYTVSTRKGSDVGYGISMPFNNVTARLTYRLVARDPNTGRTVILASGAEQAKGLAPNLEDATAKALKALADRFTPVVMDKLQTYIKNLSKTVIVKVKNVHDISENFRIKEVLQNTTWVTEVREKGLGEFVVGYPENTIYLANSLSQRGFQVLEFTPYSITLKVVQ